jgi:SEC-C motif
MTFDPVTGLAPADRCWCASGRAYSDCHGDLAPKSKPGEPLPPDPPTGWYLSPTVILEHGAIRGLEGAPMFLPSPEPVQRPISLPVGAVRLAAEPAREPTLHLRELARARFELLGDLGLDNPATLEARLGSISAADGDSLVYGVVDLAKATIDRLLEQAALSPRPTVIWIDDASAPAIVGRTMFWADHYLVRDDLASRLVEGVERLDDLQTGIRTLLELRPLLEAGIVVPLVSDIAKVAVAQQAMAATELDLGNRELVRWVKEQVLVEEGPTAREALFLRVRDGDESDSSFFLYGRMVAESADDRTRTIQTKQLNNYDPTFDYSLWIDQERRQTVARQIQETNINLAIAESLGAHYVVRTPFRARLLERRGYTDGSQPRALVWADVPVLADAPPPALAGAAQADQAVEAMRATVRLGFAATGSSSTPDEARRVARGIAEEIAVKHQDLVRSMATSRRWQRDVPGLLMVGSLAVSATIAGPALPVVALATALAGAAALSPYRATQLTERANAAYSIVLAERSIRRSKASAS